MNVHKSVQQPFIFGCNTSTMNSLLFAGGNVGHRCMQILLDSGAALSVIRNDALDDRSRKSLTATSKTAIGANGLPLKVMGQVNIDVSLGRFRAAHTFIVVKDLTFECILGVDFLRSNKAVMDFRTNTLHLGNESVMVPTQEETSSNGKSSITVHASEDTEIPGRSVRVVVATLKEEFCIPAELDGMIEPAVKLPKHLGVARSLGHVSSDGSIMVQVMNVSPCAVKVYRGVQLGVFVPQNDLLLLENSNMAALVSGDSKSAGVKLNLDCSEVSEKEKQKLRNLLDKFGDLFVSENGELGRTSVVKHSISTSGRPIRQPIRRQPESLKRNVNEEVEKMLSKGVIRPSSSPWSSPVVMVKKKNGSWRFCIDYRQLNAATHQDAYPLPRIDVTLESLAGSALFTTLDLASGYWQVEIEEGDKEKTAFSTEKGHFEFNVMPFGLTNAPATFQRLMECVLAGLTGEQCLIYIDDIIVFSSTFQEHLDRLERVFLKLQGAGLKLRSEKCHFVQKAVKYLGHVVSDKGICPDPAKTDVVANYPIPKNAKEVKQFMGLCNYYRRFVKGYSEIAAPLFKLLSKENDKCFTWTSSCQAAFEDLKSRLVAPPILAYPNFQLQFLLYTDASDSAIGAVLSQMQEGQERVIAYWSRKLQKTERNYSTTEREALAVVSALKEFYPYVYGFSCRLITDHNPLTSLRGLKDIGGRLTRWLIFLQQFNLEFQYKPGRYHTNADTLSRIPSREIGDTISVTAIEELLSRDTLQSLLRAQVEDPRLGKVVEALKNGTIFPSGVAPGLKRTFLHDGLLCRQFRASSSDCVHTQLVVPASFVEKILHQLHDESGHLGIQRTKEKVKERFYWPGYEADIEHWVHDCQMCQKRNPPQPQPLAPLGTIKCSHPFDVISWDIMGPLPLSTRGCKYILVITDLFSKWVEAFPLAATDSETLASVLVDEVVCRYGVPGSLHSDQGANLNSQVITALCKLLGINKTRTTAYHPQGNGQVERFNRTLEAILSKVVADNQKDWDIHIPKALFAYRTALHESSGYSPFRVNFGRSPILPIDIVVGRPPRPEGSTGDANVPQYVEELSTSLRKIFSDVKSHLDKAHERSKKRYDKDARGETFAVGDQVWLYVPAVKRGRTKKLASFWRGPYTVIDRLNAAVDYRIQLVGSTKTLIVHRNRLKRCYGLPKNTTKESRQKDSNLKAVHTRSVPEKDPVSTDDDSPVVTTEQAGGFVDDEVMSDHNPEDAPVPVRRTQRIRRPTDRYGIYIEH